MTKRKLNISYLVTPSSPHWRQDKKTWLESADSEIQTPHDSLESSSPKHGGSQSKSRDSARSKKADYDAHPSYAKPDHANWNDKGPSGEHPGVEAREVEATGGKRAEGHGMASEHGEANAGEIGADVHCPEAVGEQDPEVAGGVGKGILAEKHEQGEVNENAAGDEYSVDCSTNVEDCVEHEGTIRLAAAEDEPERIGKDRAGSSAQLGDTTDESQRSKSTPTSIFGDTHPLDISRPDTQPLAHNVECQQVAEYFTVKYPARIGKRRGPRCHITRTKLSSSNGVKAWQELEQLRAVQHAGETYELGDVVYIYTQDKIDSPAKIRSIRDTGDWRGRKEICVSWLWSKEEISRNHIDLSRWPGGATHMDSNWLQVFPWDTINGRPSKAEIRASPSVIFDACSRKHAVLSSNDPAIQWIFRQQANP